MDGEKLFPDGMWIFASSDGVEERDGKAYYPACLTVRMDRGDALELLEQLVRQVRYEKRVFEVSWSGSLTRVEDE